MKNFDIIVCHDSQRGIGKNNTMPWSIREDLHFFRSTTSKTSSPNFQNALIMGQKTWHSLPRKPLVDRYNCVLSSQKISTDLSPEHNSKNLTSLFQQFSSIEAMFQHIDSLSHIEKIYVMGGGQIYAQLLFHKRRKNILVTEIFDSFDCDVFFPDYQNKTTLLKKDPPITDNNITYQRKIYQ